jgi:hypothetical protein
MDRPTKLEEIAGQYSDVFKSVYGFRPRHERQETIAEYQEALDDLRPLVDEEIEHDRVRYETYLTEFMVAVHATMNDFGLDTFDAVRWLFAASDPDLNVNDPDEARHHFDRFMWDCGLDWVISHNLEQWFLAEQKERMAKI